MPKDPNNPEYIASENIHLVAEVSKTNPYLNEAITVVYKLYVSPNTGVSNWREIDSPRYNDFWSQNIDTQGSKSSKRNIIMEKIIVMWYYEKQCYILKKQEN